MEVKFAYVKVIAHTILYLAFLTRHIFPYLNSFRDHYFKWKNNIPSSGFVIIHVYISLLLDISIVYSFSQLQVMT